MHLTIADPPLQRQTDAPPSGESRAHGAELIGVGSNDDSVSRMQLAARWAEAFAPGQGDSLAAILTRFRMAYDYLDSVTHGVEPADFGPSPHGA